MAYRDTSRQAYANAQVGENQRRVLEFVRERSEATCDEAIEHLGLPHQSASPAFTALARKGLILRTSRLRQTRTGAMAAIYVPSEPDTLFQSFKIGRTDQLRIVVRAAIAARATGDWMAFDTAFGALPQAERTRIQKLETP